MSSLNLSANGPSITKSYQTVVNSPPPSGPAAASPTYGQWAVFSVAAPLVNAFQNDGGKESVLKVQSTGEGELLDLVEEFSEGRIQFSFLKVKDPNTTLPKCVLIAWCGEGVPERTKGYFTSHLAAVSNLLHGYHVQITARSDRDLTPEGIIQKVADSSGSKYSGGGSVPTAGGPPPIASKPVFTPTRVAGSGAGFNPLGSRTRAVVPSGPTDEDGWGKDAPQVTRTQLEKVSSAYQPTKVNMAELTSQKQAPSRFEAAEPQDSNGSSDLIRGGYQPVGKVDIAEIRRQAKGSNQLQDDRPSLVKGAYEPVGKVDIAAIRARAKATPERAEGFDTASDPSGPSDEPQAPSQSLAERSAAFSQAERLTTLPKPKVANKWGGGSSFTGTKAPAPAAGFQPVSNPTAAPVGIASRTFADQGGKTPAQLWAEKKARDSGGATVVSPSSTGAGALPIRSQSSGEGGWRSGYTGKSWAPVQITRTGQSATSNQSDQAAGQDEPTAREEETDESHSGGVSSIRDRFAANPPPMDMSSKPNAGPRAIPAPPESAEEDIRPSSPIRVAMPIGRSAEPEPQHEPEHGHGHGHEPAAAGQSGARALVQFDYEKAEDNEIELKEGDYVTNIDMVDADWWMGVNVHGEMGLFPSNYVELVEDGADEAPARPPATTATAVAAAAAATPPSHEPAAAEAAPPSLPPPASAAGGNIATAQYDYEAAEDNELSFPDGAKILNVEFPDEDWWHGEYNGKTGLFPANYVQLDE